MAPVPPGKPVISIVPVNDWMSRPKKVAAAPELVTPTKVSNAGIVRPGTPKKVVIVIGIDTPPPSALPAVESVDVPPPALVNVTTSAGLVWPKIRTVPAWAEEPSKSKATHMNAKERRRNRAETASC